MANTYKIGDYNVDLSNITDEARRKQVVGELTAFGNDATKAGTINPGGLKASVSADDMIKQNIASYGGILSPYSSENVVSDSSEVRTDINDINNKVGGLDTGGTNPNFDVTTGLTDKEKQAWSEYENLNTTLTSEDLANIEAEAVNAGRAYDPMISKAQEDFRKGMPKATISAGERGGFMSTQMAGESALSQTEGGDWKGRGGELKNIENIYDANIQNLQVAKQRAIEEARAAAKQAKLTGKKEDIKLAREKIEFYQNANAKALELANGKVTAISNYDKLVQGRKTANLQQIADLSAAGLGITPEITQAIDSVYGTGYAQKYYELNQKASAAQTEEDAIALQNDLFTLLNKVPVGKEVKIGNATYKGLGEDANTQIFSESDSSGTTYVTLNKQTGEIINKKFLPGVGRTNTGNNSGVDTTLLNNDVALLLSTRGSDGFVITNEYAKLYDKYAEKGSKYITEFVKRITPEVYLNPTDTTAKKYLQTASQVLNSDAMSAEDIAAFKGALGIK